MSCRSAPSAERRSARRVATLAVAALAAIGALVVGAGVDPATATAPLAPRSATPAPFDEAAHDGTWYHSHFGIDAINDDGITGEGVTVAVFDTSINPDADDLRGADLELRTHAVCDDGYDGVDTSDEASHGTNMASIIGGQNTGVNGKRGIPGVAPEAKVLHYAVLEFPYQPGCRGSLARSVQDAVDHGARILSMSFGWGWIDDLEDAVRIALKAGAVVNIAVQNEDGDALDSTSAANGVVAIENIDVEGQSDGAEVISDDLTVVAPGVNIRGALPNDGAWDDYDLGVGTSPATAWVSGVMALAMQKWPDATGNQIIQSVIRNTSNGWEELTRTDLEGFGLVSPQNLMLFDPTEYPDENPLLVDRPDAYPSWSDVRGSDTPTDWEFIRADVPRGSSIPTAEPTKRPPAFFTTPAGIGTLAAVAGGLAIAVGVGAPLIVASRRRRAAVPAMAGAPGGFAGPGPAAWSRGGPPPLPQWGPLPPRPSSPPWNAPPWQTPQQPPQPPQLVPAQHAQTHPWPQPGATQPPRPQQPPQPPQQGWQWQGPPQRPPQGPSQGPDRPSPWGPPPAGAGGPPPWAR